MEYSSSLKNRRNSENDRQIKVRDESRLILISAKSKTYTGQPFTGISSMCVRYVCIGYLDWRSATGLDFALINMRA